MFLLACNFTESNTPRWVFFTFLKLYEWYQIVQRTAYLVEIFEDKCSGNFFTFCELLTFISISYQHLMISASKNFVGCFSVVNFMFGWSEFSFSKRLSLFVFLSSYVYMCHHLHILCKSVTSLEQRYLHWYQRYHQYDLWVYCKWKYTFSNFNSNFLNIDFLQKGLIYLWT